MADITASHSSAPRAAQSLGDRIIQIMADWAERTPRMRKLRALSALSDEELAARGLRRQDIPRVVLADALYL